MTTSGFCKKIFWSRWLLTSFVLFLSTSLFSQTDTKIKLDSVKVPKLWDTTGTLFGSDKKVLAWKYYVDDRPYEGVICLFLNLIEDSAGKMEYFLSEEYTNERPFTEWHYAAIHYGPAPGQTCGFRDLHLESFDHTPTENEIYELLDRWMFSLGDRYAHNRIFPDTDNGLNEQLWLSCFGFKPDPEFKVK